MNKCDTYYALVLKLLLCAGALAEYLNLWLFYAVEACKACVTVPREPTK